MSDAVAVTLFALTRTLCGRRHLWDRTQRRWRLAGWVTPRECGFATRGEAEAALAALGGGRMMATARVAEVVCEAEEDEA